MNFPWHILIETSKYDSVVSDSVVHFSVNSGGYSGALRTGSSLELLGFSDFLKFYISQMECCNKFL